MHLLKNHVHKGEIMDKTEQFSEAIYTTMEGTFERIIKRLSSKNTFSDKRYEFVRQLYQSLDNQDKKLFSGFIKGIFSDTIASILADIDGVSDAN